MEDKLRAKGLQDSLKKVWDSERNFRDSIIENTEVSLDEINASRAFLRKK